MIEDADKVLMELDHVVVGRGSFLSEAWSRKLRAGDIVGLRGPTGSGKSTFLDAIAGLHSIARGQIFLNGQLSSGEGVERPPHLRPVAILLQDLGLWPHLSIGAQVKMVARENSIAQGQLQSYARQLQVAEFLKRRPQDLSGGEAQRCALLRTLACNRPILLLDEPCSRQHEAGVKMIDDLLLKLSAEGKCILLAGHRKGPAHEEHFLGEA